MGFFEGVFAKLTDREKLILEATQVGDFDDVVHMGILCAQLGLTPDDLSKLARLYVKGTHWNEGD